MGDKKAICYNSLTKIETYILKMLVQCSNFFHSNMQSDFLVIFSTYSTYLLSILYQVKATYAELTVISVISFLLSFWYHPFASPLLHPTSQKKIKMTKACLPTLNDVTSFFKVVFSFFFDPFFAIFSDSDSSTTVFSFLCEIFFLSTGSEELDFFPSMVSSWKKHLSIVKN